MIPARVELGVGRGAWSEALVADGQGEVWAYDLFSGSFPMDTLWDNEDRRLCAAIAPHCDGGVLERLESLGVVCVQGLFPLTFWKKRPQAVSLVRVDMDTYVATISGLELFHRLMVPGGRFLIHDCGHGGLSGVQRGVDEFMSGEFAWCYERGQEGEHVVLTRRTDD